jgi:hypothetical protein
MRRYTPVLALFVLSPFLAEFLFGATPVSNLGGLLPVTAIYGGGAVLIRELARRRGPGWGRITLLGAAYAIIEEGLALQSMFNPDLFNAGSYGGRALGVNWVWSEWTVGYHIVWSIVIPILLVELLFPTRQTEPWLGRAGVIIIGVIYTLGVLALAITTRLFITPGFQSPVALNVVAGLLVVGLAGLALGWPARPASFLSSRPVRNVPSPWLAGFVTFLTALAWFGLLKLPKAVREGALVLVPMLAEMVLVATVAALLRWWSLAGERWTDLHRLAVAFGAILVVMLVGFFFITAGNRIDQLVQGLASLGAAALLALFARRLQQQRRVTIYSSG